MNTPILKPDAPDVSVTAPAPGRADELADLLNHALTAWDEEKRVLARQLHDQLGASMTGLSMHLTLLNQQLPADSALRERSAKMQTLLATIVARNRTLQAALWNDKLEFLGIKVALRELLSEFGAQHPITARISLPDEDVQHTPAQGLALLYCAEEGLRNIACHAGATEAELILDDDEDALTLSVRDNGIGIVGADPSARTDPAAHPAKPVQPDGGHGLRLLRERARILGGELRLSKNAAGGALLRLTLPKPATTA